MRHSTKLFWLTLGLIALAWGCFAAYEAVTAIRITGDMEARARVASASEEIVLDEEDRELMDEILNFKTRIEDPERYTDLVLTVSFYKPGEDAPRYEIPVYRLSDGTNEFILHYPDGKDYLADTRSVLRLLTGGAFDPFFSYVTSAPSLKISCDGSEAELHCTENGWQYRKIDNSIFLDGVIVKDPETRFDMRHSGALTGELSLAPDRAQAEVFYGGELVYQSLLEDLGNFRPGRHGDYRVRVTAEWYDSLDRSYSGTCVYEFDLNCILPTAFWLSHQSIAQGGVLELTAEYVEDPAALSLESRFGNFSLRPLGGERYGALIPIGTNWPAGEHELTVSVGERRETLRFQVTAAKSREAREAEEETAEFYGAWRSWFADIAAGLEDSADEKYWKGPFAAPVSGAPELAFGTPYVAAETEEPLFIQDGAVYACEERETVFAGASGRVVYAAMDEELGGGIVVLDHGLGLQSWYVGLDEIIVEPGEVKLAGEALGAAGEGGIQLRVLLDGTALDPQQIYGRELLKG